MNDPVRQFLQDVLPEASWDLLPWGFLHDLYRQWTKRVNPSGRTQSKVSFVKEVRGLLSEIDGWEATSNPVRSANKMSWPEPLIIEYGVFEWMDKTYVGSDVNRRALPVVKERYEGIVRVPSRGGAT